MNTPLTDLSTQKCLFHNNREAVARCPECSHFYCRECITEHESRVLCAHCLSQRLVTDSPKKRSFWMFLQYLPFLVGIFVLWSLFYSLGHALLAIPSEFHSGEVWQSFSQGLN